MDSTVADAFTLAVGHHQGGRSAEAEHIYRLILTVEPSHPAALNNLALLLPAPEAVGLFRRAVAAEPNYVDALVNLSSALHVLGDTAEAASIFRRALWLIPNEPDGLFNLAHVLHTQGREEDAAAQYERAIQLRPDFAAALCNLGTIHNSAARTDAAAHCYRRALAQDPTLDVANLNMIAILEADGRLQEAAAFRGRLPRPLPLQVDHASNHGRTVLILANACAGNVPLETLFPSATTTRITCHADFSDAGQMASLPPHDIAFNAVGNADLLGHAYSSLCDFADRYPVLNHPAAVARTRRDRLASLLGTIPGLVVPQTIRLDRNQAAGDTLRIALANAGITCPVLARPIAGHGGEGVQLIPTRADLAAFQPGNADAYYFSAFHDLRQADGYVRKYRTVLVDGAPYPYHLAISDHWLVHYFSAQMCAAPWKREEEARFLADPAGELGPVATAAITQIGHRLGLHFAAIDYALLPGGQILLFEANATMLVHLRDNPADFPAKHRHVPAIFDAFEAMLTRHQARTTHSHSGLAQPLPLS